MSTTTGVATAKELDRHLALKNGLNVIALTGAITLSKAYGNFLRFDPGGATKIITLPAVATHSGINYWMYNSADAEGENLTINNPAAATIATIAPGEWYHVMCDGSTWYALPVSVQAVVKAMTAAGDALNVAATINHATADAEAIDATIAQLTTVRTGGSVVAQKGGATSLVADTGGVFSAFKAESTDGGGTGPEHIAFEEAGGHDASVGSQAIVGGGAGSSTRDIVIRSGAREKNDNNAGVPTSGALSAKSGSTLQSTAAAIGGASGAYTSGSGDTDATFAGATGGDSGGASYGSGGTDISAAVAATGGDTGAVSLKSGDASSTGATATSGDTGDATVGSGDSADGDSGDVVLDPGAATSGTRGTVRSVGRATTTDGVTAGTARVIGGRASASVADSTAIVQAAGGQVAFDETSSIPADTLKAGSTLHIRAVVRVSTVLNGGATLDAVLLLGGAALITAPDSTGGAAGTRLVFDAWYTVRGAPGAAVEMSGVATAVWSDTLAVITTAPLAAGAVPTIATNGALVVSATAESSAAGDGSGRVVLEQLLVNVV